MQCWYPGAQGGKAVAEALFGEFSPSGKLPVTFYRTTEELPAFTDYSMKNRTYRYMTQEALYPFGYGLSYSNFEVSKVEADTKNVTAEGVTVSFEIKNTGKLAAAETVQAYVKVEMEGTPNAQLKAFKKVFLKPGESAGVSLRLPFEAFSLCDDEGKRRVYKGNYSVYVGTSQPDKRSLDLTGKKPVCIAFEALEERLV